MESLITQMKKLNTLDSPVSETSVSETTVPENTVKETTVPENTVKETTVPDTTNVTSEDFPTKSLIKEYSDVLDKLSKLTLLDYSNILYYELSFSTEDYNKILDFVVKTTNGTIIKKEDENVDEKFIPFINKLKTGEKVLAIKDVLYKLNNEFHITVLYTGGKEDKHCDELQKYLDMKFKVSIDKIGVNDSFICIGVSVPIDLPYYGNDVKHITIGLNNFDKSKKVFPKDSFKALLDDNVKDNDDKFDVDGILKVNLKKN